MLDGKGVTDKFEHKMTNLGSAVGVAPVPAAWVWWTEVWMTAATANVSLLTELARVMNPFFAKTKK